MKALLKAAVALLLAVALPAASADPAQLRQSYQNLRAALQENEFQRALHVDSAERDGSLEGDVYAVLQHPFQAFAQALREPTQWCELLILPFNVKYCHAVNTAQGPALLVRVGRRYDQPVEQAHRLEFAFQNDSSRPDFFRTHLQAPSGPVGTRDYRITLSAIALPGGRTFMHLRYAYGFGLMGRMAMQAYLSTAGAGKVGFSVVGRDAQGSPRFIEGMRGVVERNVMRYYLAIDAYMDSLGAPPARRAQMRIEQWFTATEQYPRQLDEMDRATYVAMKRMEVERQQVLLK